MCAVQMFHFPSSASWQVDQLARLRCIPVKAHSNFPSWSFKFPTQGCRHSMDGFSAAGLGPP